MKDFFAVVGMSLVVCAIIAAFACITPMLWYCFDDWLAAITGVPELGHVPFGNMVAICMFIGFLLTSAKTPVKQTKK